MKLTEQQLLRFKELNDKKRKQRLDSKEFNEWKKLVKLAGDAANDISWWNKYPQLMKDACNIVFNEIAGTPFEIGGPVNVIGSGSHVPVGARIQFVPTIGKADNDSDAFNYQIRDLWLMLHRKYRGIGTYESSDLGIAIFAIMNFIREIARAERIYGVCSLYLTRNRSTPNVLLKALGVEPDSYTGDELADFRYQLNRIILNAKRLCLPKGFSLLEAYVTLNGQVFKDADNVRAQWYVYDTPYRVQFSGTAMTTGSACLYLSRTATGVSGLQTFGDIIGDLTSDLNSLLGDTDVQRMCSDILAALGDNVVVMNELPEDYVVSPVRDETRELQFHNATICGPITGGNFSAAIYTDISGGSLNPLVVYQEGNVIKQHLQRMGVSFHQDANSKYQSCNNTKLIGYVGKPLLNCWKDEVSHEDIMEMTRLTVSKEDFSLVDSGTTYYGIDFTGYGVYVVESMHIYDETGTISSSITQDMVGYNSVNIATILIKMFADISKIDWHPVVFYTTQTTGYTDGYSGYFFDLDNYTTIDKKALNRIHDAAVLSSLKIDASIAHD